MRRWYAKTKRESSDSQRSAWRRYYPRVRAMVISVAILLCFSLRVIGQQPLPWPKTVIIEVTKPLTQLLEYRSTEKAPQRKTEIGFRGDGKMWRFVRFEHLPETVAFKVNGQLLGYLDSEPLQPKRWYPTRNFLPVILEIKPEAKMPVEVVVSYGSPELKSGQMVLMDPSLKPEDVRRFSDNSPVKETGRQSLKFFWDAPVAGLFDPIPSSTPTSTPTPESSWWTYLTEEERFGWILLLILPILLIGIIGGALFLARVLIPRLKGRHHSGPRADAGTIKQQLQYEPKGKAKPTQAPSNTSPAKTAEMYESLGSGAFYPPPKSPGPPASSPVTRAIGLDQNGLERLIEAKVAPLRAELKVGQQDHKTLVAAAKELKAQVTQIEVGLEQRLTAKVKPVEDFLTDQGSLMAKKHHELDQLISQLTGEGEKVKKQLGEVRVALMEVTPRLETEFRGMHRDLQAEMKAQQKEFSNEQQARNEWIEKKGADGINALRMELNEVRDQLNQLGGVNAATEVSDSFYARTLGEILAQNIETLQEGNFEQLSQQLGERLNQFFKTEVPHGDKMWELRKRCEAVNDALINVAGQIAKLNPKASDAASPHLQRSATLVAEVANLQEQLQNRRLSIETTLRIPVSAYPGARQTFTDELGRGIKREVDKLSEPQRYFARELEGLITTDVIAVVDICDKEVAHPGVHPELEAALNHLFAQSALLPIMPRQGEPFREVEQDVIERVQNGSGRSSSIAQVKTRGFYYDHPDGKTLLRKAGVAVYR